MNWDSSKHEKRVIKNWIIHDALKVMSKVIDYRLQNSNRSVRKKTISINDDCVKVAEEIFKSSRLLIDTSIIVIMSSSFVARLIEKKKISRSNSRCSFLLESFVFRKEEKKSEGNLRCFLLLNCSVVDWKRKQSESNLCWFLFRPRFVVVFVVVFIYHLRIGVRHAIVSIVFFISY